MRITCLTAWTILVFARTGVRADETSEEASSTIVTSTGPVERIEASTTHVLGGTSVSPQATGTPAPQAEHSIQFTINENVVFLNGTHDPIPGPYTWTSGQVEWNTRITFLVKLTNNGSEITLQCAAEPIDRTGDGGQKQTAAFVVEATEEVTPVTVDEDAGLKFGCVPHGADSASTEASSTATATGAQSTQTDQPETTTTATVTSTETGASDIASTTESTSEETATADTTTTTAVETP